jgi:hypothetical protein
VVQCNKCGKRRGPLGDAVVKAYIDTIKIARDMGPGSGLAPHLVRGSDSGRACELRVKVPVLRWKV